MHAGCPFPREGRWHAVKSEASKHFFMITLAREVEEDVSRPQASGLSVRATPVWLGTELHVNPHFWVSVFQIEILYYLVCKVTCTVIIEASTVNAVSADIPNAPGPIDLILSLSRASYLRVTYIMWSLYSFTGPTSAQQCPPHSFRPCNAGTTALSTSYACSYEVHMHTNLRVSHSVSGPLACSR